MGPDSTNVVTLANSIIGVGILAMPFCFQKVQFKYKIHILATPISPPFLLQCGILLSIVLLLLSNFITRLSCHYLAKASILSRRRNYEYLGESNMRSGSVHVSPRNYSSFLQPSTPSVPPVS